MGNHKQQRPITVALIGAGSRGLLSYAPFFERFPGLGKVVAVAEPREWFRNEATRRHKIQPSMIFTSADELLSQEKLADSVIIATQDNYHTEPAIKALNKGYDVLLEKPMAPTAEECRQIVDAALTNKAIFAVCHVLRYTPYFKKMRQLLDSNSIGEIVSVRHFEPVKYWHQAHSYVRGNWRDAQTSSPMILAKSCHDMDILLYLLKRSCLQLSSFGSLKHFRIEQKPARATERCLDCPLTATECPYSASRFYLEKLRAGDTGWPLNVITQDFTEAGVTAALRDGPYGRCVYQCDNNAVDHQVVAMEFEGGISATFTMTAFSNQQHRQTEIYGTHGEIRGNGKIITVSRFGGETIEHDPSPEHGDATLAGGHSGGDVGIMHDFVRAVATRDASTLCSGPVESLESHLMAFAAEQSRLRSENEKVRVILGGSQS